MSTRSLVLVVVASAVWFVRPSPAEPPAPKPAETPAAEPAADWKEDPVCQMVFFAVLEGLYTDGVPDDVVDSIVPRQPKDSTNPIKTSFVVLCPLCHPVFEAFSVYQQRPKFNSDEKKRNAFGKGLAPEV